MMIASLARVLGYETCAKLAKQAFQENTTIRELVTKQGLLPPEQLDELLDPMAMTRPS